MLYTNQGGSQKSLTTQYCYPGGALEDEISAWQLYIEKKPNNASLSVVQPSRLTESHTTRSDHPDRALTDAFGR